MDCDFCNVTEATHLSVPTKIGRVAHLRDDCSHQYGRKPARRACNKKGGPRKTAQTQTQMRFFDV